MLSTRVGTRLDDWKRTGGSREILKDGGVEWKIIDAVNRVSEFGRGELHRNPKTASRAMFPVYGAIFRCNCAQ